MNYPVFTITLNATDINLLRKYAYDWSRFSKRKQEAIKWYTPKEIKKGWELREKMPLWYL